MEFNELCLNLKVNDTLAIGPFKYTVLKRDNDFVLLTWTESSGITKELWVNVKRKAA